MPASWRKVEQLRNMGAYQKGGEKKASNFPTRSTARQMVRSEISMITRFCCTSFSKSPASDAIVVSCFHLWRSLQRGFDAKPRCVELGIFTPCKMPPPPRYTHTVLMHPRHSFSRCVDRSVVSPSLPQPHVSMFHNVGVEREREQPFSLFAISLY